MNYRVDKVIEVDAVAYTARVEFADRGGQSSAPLKILKNSCTVTIQSADSHTHKSDVKMWLPKVGDAVVYVLSDNNSGDGFILGGA